MTLEQLRIFVAVAEREHVTRAAVDLNLTQSATSAAIAALEARYAIKLFNRIGRRIELTQAGRLFLVEARAVLARAATAETVLDDIAGLKRGSLRLAASQTVGNYWLPPLMHRYRASYPGIALALTIGNTETVADRSARRRCRSWICRRAGRRSGTIRHTGGRGRNGPRRQSSVISTEGPVKGGS